MEFIVIILLIIILIVVLNDVIPILYTWESRIHIGRFSNDFEWKQKLNSKIMKWLIHTPNVKVTDQTRLVIIDKLKGNYSKNTIQYWQQATLLLGLADDLTESNAIIQKFLKTYLNENGSWIKKPNEVDSAILAYAMMEVDDDNCYRQAYDVTIQLIENHVGEDGTVQYRKYMPHYRYVDTVGFICPFLTRYGLRFNNEEYVDLAFNQIRQYREEGFLNNHSIPYHAYDIRNGYPLGLCGWGRGIGWYALGLIDMWMELPKEHRYKEQLTHYVIELTQQIIMLQNSNGSWNWIATRHESRSDSSTTAILLWFLINAQNISELKVSCEIAIQKAKMYLMSVTRRDGAIDFSQGDTKDIGVYSMLFDILPFTQGMVLRSIRKDEKISL